MTSAPESGTHSPRPGAGFTLVELIAVMIVAAILGVAAAVSLGSLPETRRAAAARQVHRDLTFARERAMAGGLSHWVAFTVGTNSYSVLADDPANPGRPGALTITDPATRQPFVQRLGVNESAGVVLASASFDGQAEVGFDWLGRPITAAGTPLAADGSVQITGGGTVFVRRTTGIIEYAAP